MCRRLPLLFALLLVAARAQAYSTWHPFIGVTGGGLALPAPLDSVGDVTYAGTWAGGLELGFDSDYGWQLVLHGFYAGAVPELTDPLYGAVVDVRYVAAVANPNVQPYLSLGAGLARGGDVIGRYVAPVFELGMGVRYRCGHQLYLGVEGEWIDLDAVSVAGMVGFEL